MTIPYYNECTLPRLTYPLTNTKEESTRYLGARAVTGEITADLSFTASTDEEMKALHDFWEINCNYGLNPFVLPVPIFGSSSEFTSFDYFLVRFSGDSTDTKQNNTWDIKRTVRVLAEMTVIVDDVGNPITTDAQEGLIPDSLIFSDTIDYTFGSIIDIPTHYKIIYGSNEAELTYGIGGHAIPIYDFDTLPIVALPLKNTKTKSTRYLGNRAVTGGISADIAIKTGSDDEIKALFNFWKDECNYGLEPFLLPLPIFGRPVDLVTPALLVMFNKDLKDTKTVGQWTSTRALRILGRVDYTIGVGEEEGVWTLEDTGQFIFNEVGDYIALMSKIHTHKEINYGIS